MTLLLRMVWELLAAAALWLAALGLLAAAVAAPIHRLTAGRASIRLLLVAAFFAGAVAVAVAHRVGAPDPLGFTVWRRDFLPLWATVGSMAGAVAALAPWGAWERRRQRGDAAQ